jgi:hypothetical protein
MCKETRFIRYYINIEPNSSVNSNWIPVDFLTQKRTSDFYYYLFSHEPFSLEGERMIFDYENIGKLPQNQKIKRSECVWITPKREIYIARRTFPNFDSSKRLVGLFDIDFSDLN